MVEHLTASNNEEVMRVFQFRMFVGSGVYQNPHFLLVGHIYGPGMYARI